MPSVNYKKVVIFTAPSGAGKTTLVRHLLNNIPKLSFSVSATTRSKRYYEENGKDYYFFGSELFKKKIEEEAFLEWEEVYKSCCYGTLKSEVERIWSLDKNVIFDVDVKGAVNIKEYYGEQALAIFVKPPSIDVLLNRLKSRKTETIESLQQRMSRAKMEMNYEKEFDITIINDDLNLAKKEAIELVGTFLNKEVVA